MCEVGGWVEKPWGYEYIWAKTNDYVGKLLYMKKRLSFISSIPRSKSRNFSY